MSGSPPHTMAAEPTPAWEQSKENAAPLERGRNVNSLNRRFGLSKAAAAFSSSSSSSSSDASAGLSDRTALQRRVDEYEQKVRPSEAPHVTEVESGGDPLAAWLAYIKFYQESYPSDTNQQFLLMERCVRALVKMKHYSNDDRFIGVCAKYADKTKDPGQVFRYLHHQKIGTFTALFWIAWAFVAEKDNDFPFAEKIFKKGISKNAQPVQMLKLRHRQFQRRMSRHWLNSSRAQEEEEQNVDEYDTTTNPSQGRATLGRISRDRLRHNDRSAAGHSRNHRGPRPAGGGVRNLSNGTQPNRQSSSSRMSGIDNGNVERGNESFAIFVEPSGENENHVLDESNIENNEYVLATHAERKKENTMEVEHWHESSLGGVQSSIHRHQSRSRGPQPAFPVFVDEECAFENARKEEEERHHNERQRRVRDDRMFRERDHEGVAERLARDPLWYVIDPSRVESEIVAAKTLTQQCKQKEGDGGSSRHASDQQKAQPKGSERKGRAGFNKKLLKNRHGEEQSFEEARANAKNYTLAIGSSTNFNLLYRSRAHDHSSLMQLDDDDCDRNGSADISIAETSTVSIQRSVFSTGTSSTRPPKSESKVGISRFAGSRENSFEMGLNQTAISNASSTFNEIDDVGIPERRDDETINTKLAMRELSMMFSSPAAGPESIRKKRHNHTSVIEEGFENHHDESYENIADGLGNVHLDNSIFCSDNADKLSTQANGTKSTLSSPEDVAGGLGFTIFNDEDSRNRSSPSPPLAPSNGLGFSIFQDQPSHEQSPTSRSDGDGQGNETANLSDVMSLFKDIDDASACGERHAILETSCDDHNNESRTTCSQQIAVEYGSMHQNNTTTAYQTIIASSSTDHLRPSSSICSILKTPRHLVHVHTLLPNYFKQKNFVHNRIIHCGDHRGLISRELGRGANGVVFLLEIQNKTYNETIAVKAQSSTASLAWEWEVLKRLEDRIDREGNHNDTLNFSRPFGFVCYLDGAVMGLSPASSSGINLVDLSNFYRLQLRQEVPELVALHYLVWMMTILEQLHWKAKILHCDVKPDNFVLSSIASSGTADGSNSTARLHGLTLVDFGRAIDMTELSLQPNNEQNFSLRGKATTEEMECIAMRCNQSWSFDADYFGVLSSVHVLLYGDHLTIIQDDKGQWKSKTKLKRYWNSYIWKEVFESMLNCRSFTADDFSIQMRSLRLKIEEYLDREASTLNHVLSRQAFLLPNSREKISR